MSMNLRLLGDIVPRFRSASPVALAFSLAAISLTMTIGCGAEVDPLGRQKVVGSVTLDAAPIVDGAIRFEPLPGESVRTASGAPITNGQYEVPAKQGLAPGKYRVYITGSVTPVVERSVDEMMKHPGPPPKEEVPAKYNQKSDLTVEVISTGPNQHDFTLTKKK